MGVIYILVRVFPFWAIPLAFTFFAVAVRAKGLPKTRRTGLLVSGALLIGASVAFLFFQGHNTAVPWMHEVLNTPLLRR